MDSNYNPYSFTLLLAGVVTLLLSFLIFQGKGKAIKWFAAMMLFSAIWAIAYSFELVSQNLDRMLFWIRIEYLGIAFLPAFWILFMIRFVGRGYWLNWLNHLLIFSIPVITLVMVWTNDLHHLHYLKAEVDNSGPFPLLDITPGPWYYVHTVYFYFLLATGLFLLISRFRTLDPLFRKQNRTIVYGAFVPWIINLLYLLGLRPYGHIDLTPYAFLITSLIVGFGLLRLRLFELLPVAREKVVEVMREGVLVIDSEAQVIDLNRAMKRFLSYQKKVVGRSLKSLFPDELELHRLVREKREDKLEITNTGRHTTWHFEVTVTPLFEDRLHAGTLLIFWNITERRKTAEQLRELNELKNRLFSIIAHDLRSPLASLLSILNILERGIISDKEFKESFLPLLSRNVGTTSELLDNLLNWSRVQLNGATVQRESFDLHELLSKKFEAIERRATEKGIHLNDQVPAGTLVNADQNMITVVMRNLLGNAVKFCKRNDHIDITAKYGDNEIVLCVADSGPGMTDEIKSKLFGMGTVSTPGTQNEKGTGIGLNLCRNFVEMNGGKMWVESEYKMGSRFYFSLPFLPADHPVTAN